MSFYLLLDVGGTGIKSGVLDAEGRLLGNALFQQPSSAKSDRDTVLGTFCAVLCRLLETLPHASKIEAIGMAFPGPFDFDQGISLMQGLDKYESIYGLPLASALRERLPEQLQKTPFFFLHDVEAFARGVLVDRQIADGQRLIHLCLGTGAGSAFTCGRRVLRDGVGVPPNGWLYNQPFQETIIDDYLSARGLGRLAAEQMGRPVEGLMLYLLAEQGDSTALAVFQEFGALLAEAITPFIDTFAPHQLVLGGQISGSFRYFGSQLQTLCDCRGITITLQSQPSQMILQGLFDQYQEIEER